jgi:hypothetical protein
MFGLPVNVRKIDHNYGRTTKNPRDLIKSFNTPSDKLLSSTMAPSQDIEMSELYLLTLCHLLLVKLHLWVIVIPILVWVISI